MSLSILTRGVVMGILLCIPAFAASRSVTVEVKTPGTFPALLSADAAADVDDLTLKGTFNNDDVRHLRWLCGRDSLHQETGRKISRVDLEEVTFDKSGRPFVAFPNGRSFAITSATAIPPIMFADSPVEEVVLPSRLDAIEAMAFNRSQIREMSVPEGVTLGDYWIYGDTALTRLELPAVSGRGLNPSDENLTGLKTIVYGGADYLPGGCFYGLPDLESVTVNGPLMHFDGTFAIDCPRLKRIEFNGPVISSTNSIAGNCPQLSEVVFNGPILVRSDFEWYDCPMLKNVTVNGPVYYSENDSVYPANPADYLAWPGLKDYLAAMVKTVERYNNNESSFMPNITIRALPTLIGVAEKAGMADVAATFRQQEETGKKLDIFKTKLQLLKESPAYCAGETDGNPFSYAPAADSLLTLSRERFNLDSIAGTGDDISRMKRLLYWVHDSIPHDGSSAWPEGPLNLRNLYDICRRDDRGVNCRMLAFVLTEALLAEGIPARYVTCQSKAWDTDNDCHVICVAWSGSLNKWVWLDPTFAAFVTDENGLLLNPSEVRYRLQHDLPLVLNEDANWNHQDRLTKEEYLDEYMAKNLYIMSCNTIQQAEPEGPSSHQQGIVVALTPLDSNYTNARRITTDEAWFWQPPVMK